MQVELDYKVAKGVEHISASLLRASKKVLAGGGVVDSHSAIVRFDILHLVASQSLARDELGWRQGMGGDLRLAPWVVVENGVFLSRGWVCRVCGRGVCVVSHC